MEGQDKNFLQKVHKLNQFLNRPDVVTQVTMTMKDIFFESAGAMFQVMHFPGLRSADDYGRASSAFGFRNAAVAESMLNHSSAATLPTSLTDICLTNPAGKRDELLTKKTCKAVYQCVRGYMGDDIYSYPAMLAQELLRVALEHNEMKDEIYLTVIKQITENPSESSAHKGFDLLGICLQSFAPSDLFVNYMEFFLREKAPPGSNLVQQLHMISAEETCEKQLSLAEIGQATGKQIESGWLYLRSGDLFPTYNYRWFLLEDATLRYFIEEGGVQKKEKAEIDVRKIQELEPLTHSTTKGKGYAKLDAFCKPKFCFDVHMVNKTKHRLVTDSEEDRERWLLALREAKSASWASS